MKHHPPNETEVLQEIARLEYMAADYRTAPACRRQLEMLRNLLAILRGGDAEGWGQYGGPTPV